LSQSPQPVTHADEAVGASALAAPFRLGPVRLRNRLLTRVPCDVGEHRVHFGAHPAADSALVLADWRGTVGGPAADLAPRTATTKQLVDSGAVPGVVLNATDALNGGAADAWSAGAQVVVVLLEPDDSADDKVLDAVFGTSAREVAVCVGLSRPVRGAWSAQGDALVSRCRSLRARGVAAVHVYGREPASQDVEDVVACADRIRTEAEIPTVVNAPATCDSDDDGVDSWLETIHVAILSGRVDLVEFVGHAPPRVPMSARPIEGNRPEPCSGLDEKQGNLT
jgi:hypothetical protein